MSINRRQLTLLGISLVCAIALRATAAFAASDRDEADVTTAIEAFRKAMLAADRKQFDALCLDQLTYGHSSGRVQTKKEFIDEATNGKTTWQSITFSDQTVRIAGNNATARLIFSGENQSEGKTNAVRIGVLMVWTEQDGKWRLLARQGFKI